MDLIRLVREFGLHLQCVLSAMWAGLCAMGMQITMVLIHLMPAILFSPEVAPHVTLFCRPSVSEWGPHAPRCLARVRLGAGVPLVSCLAGALFFDHGFTSGEVFTLGAGSKV